MNENKVLQPVDLRYLSASMHAVVVAVTSVRVFLRWRKHVWWWDDFSALFGAVMMSSIVLGSFLLHNGPPANDGGLAYYFLLTGYFVPLCSARLSVLFTIIRITPWQAHRRVLFGFACFFVFQCVFLIGQLLYLCEFVYTEWKTQDRTLCNHGDSLAATQIAFTLISDLWLVFSPFWILRNILVDSGLRSRILFIFSVSVVTMFSGLVHAIVSINHAGPLAAITGMVEVAVAQVVGSASVIIPVILRQFNRSDSSADDADIVFTIGESNRQQAARLDALRMSGMASTQNSHSEVDVSGLRDQHPGQLQYVDLHGTHANKQSKT